MSHHTRAESGSGPIGHAEVPAVVVGTGLAGVAAALALAHAGVDCVLVGPAPTPERLARDTRTTALFGGSIELLRHVGVWPHLADRVQPLRRLRLIDDTGGLFRAPEVAFEAAEIGLETFGYNVENRDLLMASWACVSASPRIGRRGAEAREIVVEEGSALVRLEDGSEVCCRLVVGADGAASTCRAAAGISSRERCYPQAAIASRFTHSRPHGDESIELHRRAGPMTTVPLPGNASSLVWVEAPDEAARLMVLDDGAFATAIGERLQGLLGRIEHVGPRALFPLTSVAAEPLAARRVALVGEAGHRLPPIGAQGLNLGLRDVAWLAELAGEAVAQGEDPGGPATLAAYDRARRADVASRAMAVDALNRTLIAGLLPTDLVRSVGLAALHALAPLRQAVMREGVAPSGHQPALLLPPAVAPCVSGGP